MIGFAFADESEAKVFYKRVQAHKSGSGTASSHSITNSESDWILQINPNHPRSRRRKPEEVARSISP